MSNKSNLRLQTRFAAVFACVIGITTICSISIRNQTIEALTQKSGSVGIQGTIPSNPPTRAATITVPSNGASFTQVPITVSGLCPTGLLIKVFSNNIFVGSAVCANGSYSVQISLFSGQNNLISRDYDALDQVGPDSNQVIVTFNDIQFLQFGTHLQINSNYAEYGAPPGTELDWPIQLFGGTGPFALSVDWGDGSPQTLMSIANDGTVMLKHIYKTAGIYTVVIKAVDKNGQTAFLQVVGQGTGAIQNNIKSNSGNNVIIEKGGILIWPAIAMAPLIIAGFWVGRRYEIREIRKRYLGPDS